MTTSGIVISGRVLRRTHQGIEVDCRAGCFQRVALCDDVAHVQVGAEVVVELGHDLRHGIIRPKREPHRHRVTHRRRNAGVS